MYAANYPMMRNYTINNKAEERLYQDYISYYNFHTMWTPEGRQCDAGITAICAMFETIGFAYMDSLRMMAYHRDILIALIPA